MDALGRHWTRHAMKRFLRRYNPDDYEPHAFVGIVERIEAKYAQAFRNPFWDDKPFVMVTVKLERRNLSAPSKVRLIYHRGKKLVITVYPLRLDKERRIKVPRLTV